MIMGARRTGTSNNPRPVLYTRGSEKTSLKEQTESNDLRRVEQLLDWGSLTMGTESIVLGKWDTLGAVRIEEFCRLNGVPAGDVLGFCGWASTAVIHV